MTRATLAEWLAPLSLAADAGAALPPETAFRTALLATKAAELSADAIDPADVYFGGLLRHLGCSSTASVETKMMGDERELRSSLALADAASPVSLLRAASAGFGAGKGTFERARRVASFMVRAPRMVKAIFSERCEVAVQLATRLGLPEGVRSVLDETYERFDGKGVPHGKKGAALSAASRVLAGAELVATCAQLPGGADMARDLLTIRRGTQFDPVVVDLFLSHWDDVLVEIGPGVRARLLEREPEVMASIDLGDAQAFALAFADFADMKSPFTAGHSRCVAACAAAAGRELGLPDADCARLHTAGLLHDLGRVSVSNAIWDKPGPLDDAERETMRAHAGFTERILSASPPWRDVAILAASDHERVDGSGYPRAALPPNVGVAVRILAAADVLVALTEPRPHRPAIEPDAAAKELRTMASRGAIDRAAADAVLAGQGLLGKRPRPSLPCGITERELEVLRLLARGLVDKEIASELGLSPRTVHHHNQSIFRKIDVTTRGAAALFAVENGLL